MNTFISLLLCLVIAFPLSSGAPSSIFDRTELIQALGTYGNKVNALAQYSPITCGGSANTSGLAAAAHDLVFSTFSGKHLKYYRTAGPAPINFTLGGDFVFIGPPVPLSNTTIFRKELVTFYQFIFSSVFSRPNHWLYSTPTIDFKHSNPAFDHAPTATVVVENESRAFVCSGSDRVFQVYFNTFEHVFCWDRKEGWRICGFFENNKGIFTQPASAFTQLYP